MQGILAWVRRHRFIMALSLIGLGAASSLVWLYEHGRLTTQAASIADQQAAIQALAELSKENDQLVTELSSLKDQLATLSGQSTKTDLTTSTNHTSSAASGTVTSGARVNLLTANQSQLESLPGIGPAKAQAILEYQKHPGFKSTKDLMNVKGIGEKTYAKLAPLVTVE